MKIGHLTIEVQHSESGSSSFGTQVAGSKASTDAQPVALRFR